MMSAQDSQILETFATQVRQHFPEARIWAFGSRARGEGTWESDLDVCVVLNRHDQYVDDIIDQIAWEVGFQHEVVISVVCFAREEFEHRPMSESTLVMNILRDGIAA
jgi:predicted nucleotidyltransferase